MKGAIAALQKGEAEMGREKLDAAEEQFEQALKQVPDDYAGLVLMAKCQLMQKKFDAADTYLKQARQVYPQEAQAHYLSGYTALHHKRYDEALSQFQTYDTTLPGNPNIQFFKGVAYEGKGVQRAAADNYHRYLQQVNQGSNAQYAYNRLIEWGYIKPRR
jgi:tetratricopeptide (TPR) repeat protein